MPQPPVKIAVNGFGRIGRAILRNVLRGRDDVDLVVELVGGDTGPARDTVDAAIASGKDVVTGAMVAHGLDMYLRDEGAGGIEVEELSRLRFGGHRFRDAMGREQDRPVVGHLVELVDEYRAEIAEA